jgi:hypothetical protein
MSIPFQQVSKWVITLKIEDIAKILPLLGILRLTSAAPGLGRYRIPRSDNIFDIQDPLTESLTYRLHVYQVQYRNDYVPESVNDVPSIPYWY